ncbi:MAG: aryl-sulfate sulfotransferase [Bacteriovoracaceae bacterium]
MKSFQFTIIILLIVCASEVQGQSFQYLSPAPNSFNNTRETNIILRSVEQIDIRTVSSDDVIVTGSLSGVHAGTFTLSDDEHTLLFHPNRAFDPSDLVMVELSGEVKTITGTLLDRHSFSFSVTPQREPLSKYFEVTDAGEVLPKKWRKNNVQNSMPEMTVTDSLPPDFPKFSVVKSAGASPGNFLLTTSDDVAGVGHYLYMVDNDGKVVRYLHSPGHVYDFKVQPNGLFSFADPYSDWGYAGGSRSVHRVMDSNFTVIDSFRAGNGYDADSHEFVMLPNGHVIVHAYDIQYIDMRKIAANGNPNAIVVGSIVQELDKKKNVVFQWRSWDHIPISETYMNTAASAFDYIHVNAYDVDTDGNLLLCFRNTCDIVKLNRMTGEIMWRMGGKKNQFTFFGENEANKPAYYTFQHGFNQLPNGNLILFDNGNLHAEQFSRAVEYKIDQVNKTASVVWQYRHSPDVFAPTRGSVQRLANGNTVIGWGSASFVGVGKTMITELSPANEILFEMESLDKMPSYRAQKYVWNGHRVPAGDVTIAELLPGNDYSFNKGDTNRTGVSLLLTDATFGYNAVTVKQYRYAPVRIEFPELAPFMAPIRFVVDQSGISSFTAEITFDSTTTKLLKNINRAVVYGREFEGMGMFFPLTTVYDSVQRSLTGTTTKFGEFIIGVPDLPTIPTSPTAVLPVKNALINQTKPMRIRWSTLGHITGSHLQIANDSAFTAIVVDDSLLRITYMLWNGFEQKTKYYWRVKAINELGASTWSTTSHFTMADVFLSIIAPIEHQRVTMNTTTVISYENNFEEWVNIRLYKNGTFALKIKDSTENTGRFAWKVPAAGLTADSAYAIRMSSVLDSTIVITSPLFSIVNPTEVHNTSGQFLSYKLLQNYPNPFNPVTVIGFQILADEITTLSVFDILGNNVKTLLNRRLIAGSHTVVFDGSGLASGFYFYRLTVGGNTFTKKMLLMK